MKRFLAIYTGSEEAMRRSGWQALDETARQARQAEGFQAWIAWGAANAAAIVDRGSPLGRTKRTDASGISDTTNAIAGYVVVEAESHEAAAKLFENHPHFAIFPGEAVEIMECLPIPDR
jgi:hypothetical protein